MATTTPTPVVSALQQHFQQHQQAHDIEMQRIASSNGHSLLWAPVREIHNLPPPKQPWLSARNIERLCYSFVRVAVWVVGFLILAAVVALVIWVLVTNGNILGSIK